MPSHRPDSSPIPDPAETHDDVPRSALLTVRFALPEAILLVALGSFTGVVKTVDR
jgi:hypothetical protein